MPYPARPLEDRFWEKVHKTADCWLWTGASKPEPFGYGNFMLRKGKFVSAHRMSWIIANGEIVDGLQVLHKCDQPKCVRPDHLFLGTQRDNMVDCHNKKRWRYVARDQRGEDNPNAIFTDAEVAAMMEEINAGRGPVSVARSRGISYKTLWAIRKYKAYRT